jgi:G3E family GTPase
MSSSGITAPPPTAGIKARYIMIGGFLGAGKTTAVLRLARHLHGQRLRVGLITNDQGSHLVDTSLLTSHGFPVEEIAGGCFCCRFNSLTDAARNLSQQHRPDVFIAEPVGSCTDLVATVTYPLRRLYGDNFSIAPLTVLLDPVRALRLFGKEPGGRFSEKVAYIYRKQLEEADLLAINKIDLLTPERREVLLTELGVNYPEKRVLCLSARTGEGVDAWFSEVTSQTQTPKPRLSIDYDIYAEGEALLGWLNATLHLSAAEPFDGNEFLRSYTSALQAQLARRGAEIAHLKMTLDAVGGLGDIAVVNLVRNDFVPELSQQAADPMEAAEVILNLRAEGSPELLQSAVQAALDEVRDSHPALQITTDHLEHFRPGRPVPTHRNG